MKKFIIIAVLAIFITVAAVIVINYFNVPEHVRNGEKELESSTGYSVWIDERIGSAINEGKNYIMEEDGIDIPYSDDLLRTLENHFGTDIEFVGAGAYWGTITNNTAVELLLNSKGNVGQVEVCIAETADRTELESAVTSYIRFVNSQANEETVNKALREALPELQDLKSGEPYMYYGYGVGFAGKVENNKLFLYIP